MLAFLSGEGPEKLLVWREETSLPAQPHPWPSSSSLSPDPALTCIFPWPAFLTGFSGENTRLGKGQRGLDPGDPIPLSTAPAPAWSCCLMSTCNSNFFSIRIKSSGRCTVFGEKCQESAARLDFRGAVNPTEARPFAPDWRSEPAHGSSSQPQESAFG